MLLLPHSSPSKSCGQPRVKESDRKAYKIFLQPTTDSKVVPKTTEVKKEKKKVLQLWQRLGLSPLRLCNIGVCVWDLELGLGSNVGTSTY